MSRICCVATVGWFVVATLHLAAQQPVGSLTVPRATVARATPPRVTVPRILPGTRPDVFSRIQGNALSSTNGALANIGVRLRDARIGQIIDRQTTDKSGLFVFRSVDPGSYIVEILGRDQASVLAASQVLNVSAGDAVSAVVKLPFGTPALAGLLGNSVPSATAVTTQAAASGVLASTVSGAGTCDTLRQ